MNFRQLNKILTKNGWKLVRVKGSKYQYKKSGCEMLASVHKHKGQDISVGVLRNLSEKTGLKLL